MLYAQQGNRVKRIREDDIQYWVEKGFTIITETGQIVQETIPVDVNSLRLGYKQKEEEIEALKAQIDELQLEIASLKTELKLATSESKDSTSVEAPTPTEENTEKAEKPKGKGRGKGKTADTEA